VEKQGMVGGRRIYGSGLLMRRNCRIITVYVLLFLLLCGGAIFAQDADPAGSANPAGSAETENLSTVAAPSVTVRISDDSAETGVPWTITFFVDWDFPDEVTVIPPPFAFFMNLERIAKTPRFTDAHIQTVIEYRFIPAREGSFILEPFTVITPEGSIKTVSHSLIIRPAVARQRIHRARAFWEGKLNSPSAAYPPGAGSAAAGAPPGQMAAGERLDLILRVTGLDQAGMALPPSGFFMPEVPQGAILVSSPATAQERAGGIALKLILIPLEGDFTLPARVLERENTRFEIPALRIKVNQPLNKNPAQENSLEPPASENIPNAGTALFSQTDENLQRFLEGSENKLKRSHILALIIILFFFVIIAILVCFTFFRGLKTKGSEKHEFWGNS
jgi:uncharacterized membrane protein